MGEAASLAVQKMIALLEEIAAICHFRNAFRKQFYNLSRRIKLLAPMLEELKERSSLVSRETAAALIFLREALESAKDLLILGSEGSRICMVLERDTVMKRFQGITAQLDQSLGAIPFEKLDLPDEVQEQVELVRSQFRRAKERVDALDDDLYNDLVYSYNKHGEIDPPILRRLADDLQLMTISDLKQESLALHEMVLASGGRDPGESIEKTSMLLKKIKDFVQTQDPEMGSPTGRRDLISDAKPQLTPMPDEFRCPISLELMQEPVIVATGQTYDRGFIEQWLAAGHDTCPKTQQTLSSRSLTPNYVLRSLIAQWCEENGVDPPKPPAKFASSSGERQKIEELVRKLSSNNPQDQLAAAAELRLLAKHNAGNRLSIAETGAIPLLVGLLPSPDPTTQEHAVTALLNLSICEENKAVIVSCRAVPGIVFVLKTGTMAARENAAAALFSLSVVNENKVTIGAWGAIPALVSLLADGGRRGKKDAATALFSLCIFQGNKGKAVRAGAVPVLLAALAEPAGAMMDEAMAVLTVLASHPEGKAAIGAANVVPLFVDIIGSGSPRNRENAAAILVKLCRGEHQFQNVATAMDCGVVNLLRELALNGTDRGKRKAAELLDRLNRLTESQAEAAPDQGQLQVQLLAS